MENKPLPPLMSSDLNVIDAAIWPSMYRLIHSRSEVWTIARCTTIRKLFQKKYLNLCNSGKLQRIEEIPHERKVEYWQQSANAGEDRDLRLECCILAYVVDYLCGEDVDRWATDPLGRDASHGGGS